MIDSTPPQPKLPSVRRSLVLSFARQYTTLLFAVPTVMILSRLLTPTQVGVYSVAAATTTMIHMLRDFGVSEYLVQEKDLNDAVARSAFTINLIIAWALAVILFVSSPWIAAFYREPGLSLVLWVLSINFILLPFGSTVTALLTRSMQFGILYRINLGQQFVQSSITVALAALGFGYMSPAWGSVAGMGATVVGCFVWGRAYRVRGLGLTRWRSVARFGLQQTFGDIMNKLGFYAPDFVIGRVLGFADVGLYSRGYGLINLFQARVMGAISAVAFPAFARNHHSERGVRGLYLQSLTYVTGIALPFMTFAALMAFPIIRIMFGPQWDAAVPLLRLLAVAAFVYMLVPQFGQLFTGIGKVGVVTATTTVTQIFRIGILIPAAFYSLEAAAASQVLVSAAAVLFKYGFARKYTAITGHDLLKALLPSLGLTAAAALVPAVVYGLMPISGPADLWLSLIVAGTGGGSGWLLGAWLLKHPLWLEMINALNRVHRRKGYRHDRIG